MPNEWPEVLKTISNRLLIMTFEGACYDYANTHGVNTVKDLDEIRAELLRRLETK